MQDLESPEGHGWVRDEKHLLPLLMTKAPAPESASARRLPACETAPATTQGFLVLKDATAWQMMKYVKTRMVLPA